MIVPKVLIVNDNPRSLSAYKNILTDGVDADHYEVLTAGSGDEALRLVLRHDFAVVLLDVNMPVLDGFSTAEIIHSNPRLASLPIIFLTAHVADELNRLRGYEKGAADYIFTPVMPKVLKAKVSVFVNLARERMELKQQKQELSMLNRELQLQRVRDLEKLNAELQYENAVRRKAELEAHDASMRDPLTGLLNRRPLLEYIDLAIACGARYEHQFALLFIDINRFKAVNDTHGHLVGDSVLVQVAERISGSVREADVVARFGGDEFVILLKRVGSHAEAAQIAQKLMRAIELPIDVQEMQLQVAASIGIAVFPENGATAQELLRHGDLTMHAEKQGDLETDFD